MICYLTNVTSFQASSDSLNEAESFEPVEIDIDSLKNVLNKYEKHRKISMSTLKQADKN